MSEQSRTLVVLRMLATGFSPSTGLALTPDDLKSDEVKLALNQAADAIAAANQPAPAPVKKVSKAPRKPRAPRVAKTDAQPPAASNGAGEGSTASLLNS